MEGPTPWSSSSVASLFLPARIHKFSWASTNERVTGIAVKMTTVFDAPEWKLLLAASSPEPTGDKRARLLLKAAPDWNTLLRLADRHGLLSLLYLNLEQVADAVPAAALSTLRKKYELNIHKSLFLTRELTRILHCLQELQLAVLPYKGVVLSEIYYGDMALRQCGDMDLFAQASDIGRIKNTVRELGYVPRVAIPQDAETNYIASGYEYTFDSPAGKNLLELQWALQPRYYAVDFDMKGLFSRAVEVPFAGGRVHTLSSQDLLLVLCIHAAKHVWGRLIWLRDVVQIVQQDLNWDWIESQARALGIERILRVTLLLGNRLLGMQIPSAIAHALQSDRAARNVAEEIAASMAAGVDYEEHKVAYFRLMLRLREKRMDRMRFLTRLTFTPGPGEWEAVRLPRVLFPIYPVVRLARLSGRFARG